MKGLLIILGLIFFLGCVSNPNVPVACTDDAKICPDGSSVGRIPPSCEFAPCPVSQTTLTPEECRNQNATVIGDPGDGSVLQNGCSVNQTYLGFVEMGDEGGICCKYNSNPLIQISSDYVADETTIPSSAIQKFDEISPTYEKSFGTSISFCQREGEGFYVVIGSGGFAVAQYYYSTSGEDLGMGSYTDVQGGPWTAPPVDITAYTCTVLKENKGEMDRLYDTNST
ncbi:MAG: hypothetical protein FJY86_03315 [Candidatus Diapherotrites archaeon]|uniref:Lipoprotein n=1 Tax=Candidatus Iainarchaeum sp. TaxID=3101447 RepID=A0A8T4C6Z3_9ARCH|nr:hypothetical protein [Candidatus Diapherotrites archaeon]